VDYSKRDYISSFPDGTTPEANTIKTLSALSITLSTTHTPAPLLTPSPASPPPSHPPPPCRFQLKSEVLVMAWLSVVYEITMYSQALCYGPARTINHLHRFLVVVIERGIDVPRPNQYNSRLPILEHLTSHMQCASKSSNIIDLVVRKGWQQISIRIQSQEPQPLNLRGASDGAEEPAVSVDCISRCDVYWL
jgi:hypothetical protein